MARTKQDTQVEQFVVENDKALAEVTAETNMVASADTVIMASFDAVKAIGRIEAMQFAATVAEKVIAETAIAVKESKQYKGLPYKDENGTRRHVATFEEFCEVFLGKSARRVRELTSNYKHLGPELYEQAERLGFSQRDYNALKALPAEDRQLITQAMEEESLDKALDIMQEMAARHHAEKERVKKEREELAQTLEVKDKLIAKKQELIDRKDNEIVTLEGKLKKTLAEGEGYPGEAGLLALQQYVSSVIVTKIQSTLRAHLSQLYKELDGDLPAHLRLGMGQSLGLIVAACYQLAEDYALEPQTDADNAVEFQAKAEAEMLERMMAEKAVAGELVN